MTHLETKVVENRKLLIWTTNLFYSKLKTVIKNNFSYVYLYQAKKYFKNVFPYGAHSAEKDFRLFESQFWKVQIRLISRTLKALLGNFSSLEGEFLEVVTFQWLSIMIINNLKLNYQIPLLKLDPLVFIWWINYYRSLPQNPLS